MEEGYTHFSCGRLGIIPRRRVSQTLLRRPGAKDNPADTGNSAYIPNDEGCT
jgi:hypothetical protein